MRKLDNTQKYRIKLYNDQKYPSYPKEPNHQNISFQAKVLIIQKIMEI